MTADPSRVRIRGPLSVHAVGFGEELLRRGYPPERAARHVALLAGLSQWLEQEGLTGEDLSQEHVERFLEARRAAGYAEVPLPGWAMTLLGWVPGLTIARPVGQQRRRSGRCSRTIAATWSTSAGWPTRPCAATWRWRVHRCRSSPGRLVSVSGCSRREMSVPSSCASAVVGTSARRRCSSPGFAACCGSCPGKDTRLIRWLRQFRQHLR